MEKETKSIREEMNEIEKEVNEFEKFAQETSSSNDLSPEYLRINSRIREMYTKMGCDTKTIHPKDGLKWRDIQLYKVANIYSKRMGQIIKPLLDKILNKKILF
ncbi:MAG: hypothetical protein ACFFDN_18120 [Candidatus Hodarchaeota archaeon]